MENEIEKAYYNKRVKKYNFNKPFEYTSEYQKESFNKSLSFKLFALRWHFSRLCEQIKAKFFNSQKHTY